ncbi:class II aldolase/adducin family protein [Halomonas sp. ML-15]|uniref:class II aldolase/adducin family protein n=1 Tax=Halomonas sp. ML-15 TaxID=2773305 RepID=UPI0017465B43|nr:class II aldolase/adducin family protein [Halomonas sp. ML-15]MBD3896612.1 class II aldolase/adducin family protein [Halomonas sp. ML-15]
MTASISAPAPHGCSREEWRARCELAALYRLIAYYRMTDLIDTHLTLRVPGAAEHFLINHYGVPFEQMRASDLVRIDHDGRVDDPLNPDGRVNVAGFVIHSAIHAARPELGCVIHTHTAAGMAVSAQAEGLLPLTQHAMKFHGKLAYHEYEGVALDVAERERLVADLGPHKAMILRNHGLLAAGESVAEAFMEIYFLERACQAQVQALAGGRELHLPSEAVQRHTAAQFDAESEREIVELAWRAALRLIEEQRSDYCR